MDFNKLKNKSDNFYSQALTVLGWIVLVLGFIGSMVLASNSYEYGTTIFFTGLLTTAISGFIILGLSEIISILNDNRRLLASIAQGGSSNPADASNAYGISDQLPEI